MSIAARADGIPFLINVTYASKGKLMSNGTVQVHFANGKLLKARYTGSSKMWMDHSLYDPMGSLYWPTRLLRYSEFS